MFNINNSKVMPDDELGAFLEKETIDAPAAAVTTLGQAKHSDDTDHQGRRRKLFTLVAVNAIIVLFCAAASLAVVLASKNNDNDNDNNNPVPPTLMASPKLYSYNIPLDLPGLPVVPTLPCPQDVACGFVMSSIDPVMPPSTRDLLNIPGTCQNWAREWLRTGNNVTELPVHRVQQRFALAVVYCEFGGDDWPERRGELWVSDLHECDWHTMEGINPCDSAEQYEIIQLDSKQLRGMLPVEISMMPSLREINLSNNLLEGPIPPDFAKLSKLDTLVLSFNLFKGKIPDFMWKYEDMIQMDLAYNFFDGKLLSNIPLMEPNLRFLFLENNDMSGPLPANFGDLDWKQLHLDGNNFDGPIPQGLFQGKQGFEELYLHRNKLKGKIPPGLGDMKNLSKLTLYENSDLTGDINEICKNFDAGTGVLDVAQVDKANVACDCCSDGA